MNAFMQTLSWFINIGAAICWMINIKHRKLAMMGFTIVTLASIWYFIATRQTPFILRAVFYLCIDVITLWHIFKEEVDDGKQKEDD
jgi:Ca2+/Na+ antiporter